MGQMLAVFTKGHSEVIELSENYALCYQDTRSTNADNDDYVRHITPSDESVLFKYLVAHFDTWNFWGRKVL